MSDLRQAVDIRNTLSIEDGMKNGLLYESNTLNDLWPRQRVFPALWFQHEDAGIRPTVQAQEKIFAGDLHQ
jgi:hypothetical protein